MKVSNIGGMALILRSAILLVFLCVVCDGAGLFDVRQQLGTLNSELSGVSEASGLAASRRHSDILYTHNDKGDSSHFFAINATSGVRVAEFVVNGVSNYDWEDMALGPCADDCQMPNVTCGGGRRPSRFCLYIADIGDHSGDGAHNNIYMIREPQVLQDARVDVVSTLKFDWPEENAETLMVSPAGELFVVSKTKNTGARAAQLPSSAWGGHRVDLDVAQTVTLRVVSPHKNPRGGDISPGGEEMLIVFAEDMYYYTVDDGDYLKALGGQTPIEISTYETQLDTQAVAWDPYEQGFYTLPEGQDPPIYFYPRAFIVVG